MSSREEQQTVVLVTGANRGIGLGLTASLLLRPNHTIITTIRNASTPTIELLALPKAEGNELVIVYFDIPTDIKELEKQGAGLKNQLEGKVTWIDTVIACAGLGRDFESVKDTGLASLGEHFWANCGGSLVLFQATKELLLAPAAVADEAGTETGGVVKERKFILISSSLGSIGDMEDAIPSLAYGVSKAGANYFLRKLAFEEGGLVALAVHPGWVKTENGQNFADSVGVKEPPMSSEESVMGVLKQIDSASKANTGTFVSYDGTAIKW